MLLANRSIPVCQAYRLLHWYREGGEDLRVSSHRCSLPWKSFRYTEWWWTGTTVLPNMALTYWGSWEPISFVKRLKKTRRLRSENEFSLTMKHDKPSRKKGGTDLFLGDVYYGNRTSLCCRLVVNWLVVWLPCSIFPYIGFLIIPTDFHILQRGWNHQPDLCS